MSTSKRHHYVPQFYLGFFLPGADSPTFWVYNKDGGPPRAQTPQNTAVERHFYSVEIPGGGRDDLLERALAQIEGVAKPILARWQVPGTRPEPAEVQEVAIFLGFMHARVPRAVEVAKQISETLLLAEFKEWASNPDILREMLERYEAITRDTESPSVDEMRSFLEEPEKHFRFEINPKFALAQALITAEMVRRQLLTMNWSLCDAPTGEFFVTSDCPVCLFFRAGRYAGFGGGLALPHVEVSFPISPQVCLVIDRRHRQRRRRVSQAVVAELNRRAAWVAERFVISPVKSNRVQRLVDQAAKTREMPKVDRIALLEARRARRHRQGR